MVVVCSKNRDKVTIFNRTNTTFELNNEYQCLHMLSISLLILH